MWNNQIGKKKNFEESKRSEGSLVSDFFTMFFGKEKEGVRPPSSPFTESILPKKRFTADGDRKAGVLPQTQHIRRGAGICFGGDTLSRARRTRNPHSSPAAVLMFFRSSF